MYPELLSHIKRYVQLNPRQEELLCSKMELRKYKRKEFILQQGKVCPGNYFILKGLVRQYFVTNKLNEQIIQFGLESWWIADQDSLLNNAPSTADIQAIEATEILLLTEENRKYLCAEIPALESYFRMMMQKAFIAMQRRIGFIFNQSDEERYHTFVKLQPAFVQRVPQYMLASYLGFTPQFLSRIRGKKATPGRDA